MQACAHVFAAHVQAFAACGVSTRHRPVLITCARWNGGKGKHGSAWRTKTAATSKEEEAQRQRRQHVPANEEDAHVQTGRMEDPTEWEDEVEDGLVWDEYQGEETAGLNAEEDYVTPGNRIVLDACDDLFEMVEEEMKVLRQASELLELLGVSMETPGRKDTPTEESEEHAEEERTGQEQ